jgi:hypothetical protein
MKSRLPHFSAFSVVVIAALAIARPAWSDEPIDPRFAPITGSSDAERAATTPYASEPATSPAPATADDNDLPIGGRLLLQAINQLERRNSISARLRHQLSLDGSQMYGVGSYWQQGRGDELQVRFELQIAGGEASLLEASNGWTLWTDRRLPIGRTVTRINLRSLRAELQEGSSSETGESAEEFRSDEFDAGPSTPKSSPHTTSDLFLVSAYGGLPGLLASLVENFDFLPPQAMRLSVAPPLAAQPMDIAVYAVVGHWKPVRLAALVETDKAEPIPSRIPQEVLLLVGQGDLFPYRIEYRGLETPTLAGGAPAAIYHLSADPLVVLELTDVKFDAPIAAGIFDYAPPNAVWSDQTNATLERLRSRRRQELAERAKAAATR